MRGADERTSHLFSYVSPEQRVQATHPLRPMRQIVDRVLTTLSPRFAAMYSKMGRPSIPPEQLLRALLLQVLYTVRSERLLMEQLEYNLLFRWFVGLNADDPVWDVTVFSKNRDRLLAGDIATAFFQAVRAEAESRQLTSDEHFTVDGTLVEAWAGLKSFKKVETEDAPPPDAPGNPTVDFHGETRTNATHASTTDPEARLARKSRGQEAQLAVQLIQGLLDGNPSLTVTILSRPPISSGHPKTTSLKSAAARPMNGRSLILSAGPLPAAGRVR